MPTVSAESLPDHLGTDELSTKIVVVIDVLRATTTIAHALDHGAACVFPVASIDSARMIAHERPNSLLCGERSGIRPDGFQLGNSPLEYTTDHIANRDLVLTTTNGTRALHMCASAHTILTGSITNLVSLCEQIRQSDQDVVLVCSGTDRRVSLEDCICAGLIAERLQGTHELDDSASLMSHAAHGVIERSGGLGPAIASSFHAKRLEDLGFGRDVEYAAQLNKSTCVPCFDPATGEIRPLPLPNAARG